MSERFLLIFVYIYILDWILDWKGLNWKLSLPLDALLWCNPLCPIWIFEWRRFRMWQPVIHLVCIELYIVDIKSVFKTLKNMFHYYLNMVSCSDIWSQASGLQRALLMNSLPYPGKLNTSRSVSMSRLSSWDLASLTQLCRSSSTTHSSFWSVKRNMNMRDLSLRASLL